MRVGSPARKVDKFMTEYLQGNFAKKPVNDVLTAVKKRECEHVLTGKAEFDLFSSNSYVNVGCGFSQIGDIIASSESVFVAEIDAGLIGTSCIRLLFFTNRRRRIF